MPGRKCTICGHKMRNEIDQALVVSGSSIRLISQQFQVSKDALARHVRGGHIEERLKLAQNAHEALAADNLIDRIQRKYSRLEKMAKDAQNWGDPELELRIYREEGRFMEIEGKATGAFREKMELSGRVETQVSRMTDEEVEKRARSILGIK